MSAETIINALGKLILTQTGYQLKEVEKLVIKGTWEAKTYSQIADNSKYQLGYIKQAAAPRLWKLLSQIFAEDISKTNFRVVMERILENDAVASISDSENIRLVNQPQASLPDSQPIPQVGNCYGRAQEIILLKNWLCHSKVQLISIIGMAGIGKTTLAVSCLESAKSDFAKEFEAVIWQELKSTASFREMLIKLIQLTSVEPRQILPTDLVELSTILLANLAHQRYLIVLDVATIYHHSETNNNANSRDLGRLIWRIGQESHQSSVVLLAREQPKEILALEAENFSVCHLMLKGLKAEAQSIFQAKKLLDQDRWDELRQIYRGNPLALKIIANTIAELFGGRVGVFLQQKTIVFGELNDILDEQFECLSALEIEILYWLTFQRYSFAQLSSAIFFTSSNGRLIEALESLLRRSLIARELMGDEVIFSVPLPVLRQYIVEKIAKEVCQVIDLVSKSKSLEHLGLLRTISLTDNLTNSQSTLELKKSLIINQIVHELCMIYPDESLIQTKISSIIALTEGKTFLVAGYAQANLTSLSLVLEIIPNSKITVSASF